jgi:hypothetical protein
MVPAATADIASASVSSVESTLQVVHAGDAWVLIWGPSEVVRVNGVPRRGGIHVLRDRDEVAVARQRPMFFSAEQLPRISVCEETEEPEHCPRCNSRIEPGTKIVCCPGCGVTYCQSDDRQCWTYAERCTFCPQKTALNGTYSWTPEDL